MSRKTKRRNESPKRAQKNIAPSEADAEQKNSDQIVIPKQLQDPEFRFMAICPEAHSPGGNLSGKSSIKNGHFPPNSLSQDLLSFDSTQLTRQLQEHKAYGVATGHGGLVIIEMHSLLGWFTLEHLPKTFLVINGDTKTPQIYFKLSDIEELPTQIRGVPLSDSELDTFAYKLLEEGDKACTKMEFEPLFSLKGDDGGVIGPNSRTTPNTEYRVVWDYPIATVTSDELDQLFGGVGIAGPDRKELIIRRAMELSPEFNHNITETTLLVQRVPEPAPWNSDLWREIKSKVTISEVYRYLGEDIASSGSKRFKCLLCQGSVSGQDVWCKDDRSWYCCNCQAKGGAHDVLVGVRGKFDKTGLPIWFRSSIEFAGLAGGDYQKRWTDYLHTCLAGLAEEWSEKPGNPILQALYSTLVE